MSYNYTAERPRVFTEEGSKALIATLDKARACFKVAGAVRASVLLNAACSAGCSDTWVAMAVIDHLVETKYIKLIDRKGAWQDNVYVDASEDL